MFALDHGQRPVRIDAAGIDRQPRLLPTQQAKQRQAGAARTQVPKCQVHAGNHLRDRSRLAGLQRQDVRFARGFGVSLDRIGKILADQQGCHHGVQQAGAVFRATGRKIAPDLAPTHRAIGVFGAHKHRRPLAHDAKRGAHRNRAGAAQYKRLQLGQMQG